MERRSVLHFLLFQNYRISFEAKSFNPTSIITLLVAGYRIAFHNTQPPCSLQSFAYRNRKTSASQAESYSVQIDKSNVQYLPAARFPRSGALCCYCLKEIERYVFGVDLTNSFAGMEYSEMCIRALSVGAWESGIAMEGKMRRALCVSPQDRLGNCGIHPLPASSRTSLLRTSIS